MLDRTLTVAAVALLLTSTVGGVLASDGIGHPGEPAVEHAVVENSTTVTVATPPNGSEPPPHPSTEPHGFDPNFTSQLWSLDNESNAINASEYRDIYGENRTAIQEVANLSDITYGRPPATAAEWTAADFGDLSPGGPDTSVHPQHANLTDGSVLISDAHATMFAVHPSTRLHEEANRTPLFIATNGTVRGLVDYRVDLSLPGHEVDNSYGGPDEWVVIDRSVSSHGVDNVTFTFGSESWTVAGTKTPAVDYDSTQEFIYDEEVTLRANVTGAVNVTRTYWEEQCTTVNNSTTCNDVVTGTSQSWLNETVTATQTVENVELYNLSATVHYTTYPDGDDGVYVATNIKPFHSFVLNESRDARVRSVWRFYTRRDTSWDRLVSTTDSGSTVEWSPAIPAYVHSHPSLVGVEARPGGPTGPQIRHVSSFDRAGADETIHEHVRVSNLEGTYDAAFGIDARYSDVDHTNFTILGIVRGTTGRVNAVNETDLRRAHLNVSIVNRSRSGMTLNISLTDAQTGDPIVLDPDIGGPGGIPGPDERRGTVTVDGTQVDIPLDGQTTYYVDSHGRHVVRYEPESWIGSDMNRTYVATQTSVEYHPLLSIYGIFYFVVDLFFVFLPLLLMLYMGLRLRAILPTDDRL